MVLQGKNCKINTSTFEAILKLELEGSCRTMADVQI
jgi:hypothetical protein